MKYLKILYVQVLIGIILGIVVGLLFPGFFQTGKIISDVFISLIKMVIAPIIFFYSCFRHYGCWQHEESWQGWR